MTDSVIIFLQITETDRLHVKQRKNMFNAKSTAEIGQKMAYIE